MIITGVQKITYAYGLQTPILPPILKKSRNTTRMMSKQLHWELIRSRWIPWHIRCAVKQIDTVNIINASKIIQNTYRKYYRRMSTTIE